MQPRARRHTFSTAVFCCAFILFGASASADTDTATVAVDADGAAAPGPSPPIAGGGPVAGGGGGARGPPLVLSSPVTLSFRPRVVWYERFLTDAECDWLIAQTSHPRRGFKPDAAYNSVYFGERELLRNAPLRALEDRIAAVTFSPTHPDEEPLLTHRIMPEKRLDQSPSAEDAVITRAVEAKGIENLHHDKANKPFTSVTVLAYLSDVPEGHGGHTVFPCTGAFPAADKAAAVDEDGDAKTGDGAWAGAGAAPQPTPVAPLCARVYDAGVRWHNGKRTVTSNFVQWTGREERDEAAGRTKGPEDPAVAAAMADMLRAGAAACRDELPGALRVRPRRGSAVVFWHDRAGKGAKGDPDGDPMAWHTGCPVLRGADGEGAVKWTMQKFKETPMRWREHPPRRQRQ